MTDTDPGIGCLEALDYLVLHRLMGNQPAQGGAALPGGAHRAEQDAAHRQVEVGAWRQDHRVVAAQFEDAASETRRHPRRHFAPHASAAGGADQGDATVVHQRFAGLAVTDQQLAQVRRRIAAEGPRGTLEQCLAGQCGEGSSRRLPDHGITADQRQRGIPRPHRDWEVERADHAYHAQRVPGLAHVVAGTLGCDGKTVQLAREAHREVADIDHFLDFAEAFLGDLARLPGHQFAEFGLVPTQFLAEQPHQFTTARRRHLAPGAERLFGALDLGGNGGAPLQSHRSQATAVDGGMHGKLAIAKSIGVEAETAQQSVDHVRFSWLFVSARFSRFAR